MLDVVRGTTWRIRIGLHTGPAVAGVIGTWKFGYDVWGDTVNIASRLESTSLPNRIQASEAIARALGDGFELEPRGTVELKGKGPMSTFFLIRRAER
jgi:class 3 adenylate cyclase